MKLKLDGKEKANQREMLKEIGRLHREKPKDWREQSLKIAKQMETLFGAINY